MEFAINPQTGRLDAIGNSADLSENQIDGLKSMLFANSAIQDFFPNENITAGKLLYIENKLYILLEYDNKFLTYDFVKNEVSHIPLPDTHHRNCWVYDGNDYIYIADDVAAILERVEISTGNVEVFSFANNAGSGGRNVMTIVDGILYAPKNASNAMNRVDLTTMTNLTDVVFQSSTERYVIQVVGKKMYLPSASNANFMDMYDTENEMITRYTSTTTMKRWSIAYDGNDSIYFMQESFQSPLAYNNVEKFSISAGTFEAYPILRNYRRNQIFFYENRLFCPIIVKATTNAKTDRLMEIVDLKTKEVIYVELNNFFISTYSDLYNRSNIFCVNSNGSISVINLASIFWQDVSDKQNKIDNSLQTTNKTVAGAINEIFSGVSNAGVTGSGHVIANNGALGLENPERFAKYLTDEWGNYSMKWFESQPGITVNRAVDMHTQELYEFLRIDNNNQNNSSGLILAQSNPGSYHAPALIVDTYNARMEYKCWDYDNYRSVDVMNVYKGRFSLSNYDSNYDSNYYFFETNDHYLKISGWNDNNNRQDPTLLAANGIFQSFVNGQPFLQASPGNLGIFTDNGRTVFNVYTGGIYSNDETGNSIFYASKWGINGFGSNGHQFFYAAPNYLTAKNGTGSDYLNASTGGLAMRIADGSSLNGNIYFSLEANSNGGILKLYHPYFGNPIFEAGQINGGSNGIAVNNYEGKRICEVDSSGLRLKNYSDSNTFFNAGTYQISASNGGKQYFVANPDTLNARDYAGNIYFNANQYQLWHGDPNSGATKFSTGYGINYYEYNSSLNANVNVFSAVSGYLTLRNADTDTNVFYVGNQNLTLKNSAGNDFFKLSTPYGASALELFNLDGSIAFRATKSVLDFGDVAHIYMDMATFNAPIVFGSEEIEDYRIAEGKTTLFVENEKVKAKMNIGGVMHTTTLSNEDSEGGGNAVIVQNASTVFDGVDANSVSVSFEFSAEMNQEISEVLFRKIGNPAPDSLSGAWADNKTLQVNFPTSGNNKLTGNATFQFDMSSLQDINGNSIAHSNWKQTFTVAQSAEPPIQTITLAGTVGYAAAISGNIMYMPASGAATMLKLDLTTKQSSVVAIPNSYQRRCCAIYNNKLYMPQDGGYNLEVLDLTSLQTIIVGLPSNTARYTCAIYNGYLYIPYGNKVDMVRLSDNNVTTITLANDYERRWCGVYNGILYMPANNGMTLDYLNLTTQAKSAVNLTTNVSRFAGAIDSESGKLYLPQNNGTALQIVDLVNGNSITNVTMPSSFNRNTCAFVNSRLFMPQYGGTGIHIYTPNVGFRTDVLPNNMSRYTSVTNGSMLYLPEYGGSAMEIINAEIY